MKKIVKIIISIIVISIAMLFAANEAIRVGDDSGESIGIIEKYFFEKSELSLQQHSKSDNYILWEKASYDSNKLLDLFEKHGFTVIENDELKETRMEMINLSKKAYISAKKIDLDYLRESNSDLPIMYSTKIIPALNLFIEGLTEKKEEKLNAGVKSYNEFILWYQNNIDNFNPLQ
ncbi:MAG: hypothetical protein M0P71_16605 [Melioribacteraceae bacterium]|nr:hypothetical protein [Melioribacteraceae bacterium]